MQCAWDISLGTKFKIIVEFRDISICPQYKLQNAIFLDLQVNNA